VLAYFHLFANEAPVIDKWEFSSEVVASTGSGNILPHREGAG
jgi:hypothetical protein